MYIFADITFLKILLDFIYELVYIYNKIAVINNGILLKKRRAMPMIVFLPLRAASASQCKNVSEEIRREMMVVIVALGKEPFVRTSAWR